LFPELKGKILFVFSDPGGAKPLLALAEKYPGNMVLSDREHPFYNDFKVEVTIAKSNYENIISTYAPELIMTGTSYRSDIEKKVHQLAKQKQIPCYAFIDHWTAMRKRFENTDGTMIVPNLVWVIDERAKKLAIEDGLPETNIVITGNPYTQWLANWKPVQHRQQFLHAAGIPDPSSRLLLFAPDPISNINGKDQYGFDELSATQELVTLLNNDALHGWTLLFKTHPNQNLEALHACINKHPSVVVLPADIDTNTCLYYADVVMGFFSNILLEADILKKTILRYLPNTEINDPIAELQIGTVSNRQLLPGQLNKMNIPAWN
jgi:hypothetical protein